MNKLSEKAQELLNGRVQAVEELGAARDNLDAIEARYREELSTAQRQFNDAYASATSAGWTDRELRELGVQKASSKRGGGRPRVTRRERTATPTRETPRAAAVTE